MADLPIQPILLRLPLTDDGAPWSLNEIDVALGEEFVHQYTIERFFSFLEANPNPDPEVHYVDREPPTTLEQLDTGNLVAKLLRFIDAIDPDATSDEWGRGLLREEISCLASAVTKLIEIFLYEHQEAVLARHEALRRKEALEVPTSGDQGHATPPNRTVAPASVL